MLYNIIWVLPPENKLFYSLCGQAPKYILLWKLRVCMKLMKRMTSLILAAGLLLVLPSCSQDTGETVNQTGEPGSQSTDLNKTTENNAEEEKISESIHINQIGYETTGKKVAIIKGQHKTFNLVDSKTGKVVFSKELSGKKNDESSGDSVCYADFSEYSQEGEYYLSVPGLGKSYNFKLAGNPLYSDVEEALQKALYYQRCGIPLEYKFASAYTHKACHQSLAGLYGNETVELDVSGGWHDAGDYGRYVVPAAITAADLMLAYEFFPDSFKTQINIPESSNSVPDILDEARYGIEWMLKMQDRSTGGVYHKVTSRTLPDMITMPEADVDDLLVMPVSTTATADFAAVTAMAARIFKTFDPAFSEKCLSASLKAWEWLEKNKSFIEFKNPQDITSGEYGDGSGADELSWASAELFRTTNEDKFNDYFTGNYKTEGFGLGWQNVSGFAAIAYMFSGSDKRDEGKANELKKSWLDKADMFVSTAEKDGYLLAMHKMEYGWGSNMNVANHAIHMLIADKLKRDNKYTGAAADCASYLLGRNTLNQSYITGFGSKQVMNPHHRPSAGDAVSEPVPGLLVGGPDSALEDDTAKEKLAGKAPAKCYIDDVTSYSTNEVATYWNSSAIFLFAYLNSPAGD